MARSGRTWRRRAAVPVVALASFALLLGAAELGMRIPGLSALAPFGQDDGFGYASGPSGPITPIRDDLLERLFGPERRATTREAEVADRRAGPDDVIERPPVFDHAFTNDDFADAVVIPGPPFTARTTTTTASRQPGEPTACGGGTTVWYRYRASADRDLVAQTFGTDHATALTVYEGTEMTRLTSIGCDEDLRGNALVPFAAEDETTYYFQIAAPVRGGSLVFTLEPTAALTWVSRSASGEPGNADSMSASLSADGRLVAFDSYARNLDEQRAGLPCHPPLSVDEARQSRPPTDACGQIYVLDRPSGRLRLVSKNAAGEMGDSTSDWAYISGDGRFVAFRSHARNLVAGDTNMAPDIFVRDLRLGRTERVSVSSSGRQSQPIPTAYGPLGVDHPSISDDGRYVAFVSSANDLVPDDTNGIPDVFVHDRVRRTTERITVNSEGTEQEATLPRALSGNRRAPEDLNWLDLDLNALSGYGSFGPSISGDGRYVAFRSRASNLVDGDTNDAVDMFVHDRLTRTTERVSVSSTGEQGNDDTDTTYIAARPLMSGDGRFVVFGSWASNLVDGDTNEQRDVFVRDRRLGRTIRVSVSSAGEQATNYLFAGDPTISANGRVISFVSNAENLAPGGRRDEGSTPIPFTEGELYVHDLRTRTTERLPFHPPGGSMEGTAKYPFLSADGRIVGFQAACVDFNCGSAGTGAQIMVFDRPRR